MIKEIKLFVPSFNDWKLNETAQHDAMEKVLNIKAKFRLCKRCGNQLHHSIRTCTRCGQKHGYNNGATLRDILYTAKYRAITKDPTMFTPELFFETYKQQLEDAGVTKEMFVKYTDKI